MSYSSALLLIAGSVLWCLPFAISKWHGGNAIQKDTRARPGMLLQLAGYLLSWTGAISPAEMSLWRELVTVTVFGAAIMVSFFSVRALGPHLRLDASLGAEHVLVRTGPYRLVRHPIFSSILLFVLASGLFWGNWLSCVLGVVVAILGTEIRVRVEDGLLLSRFGEEFVVYRDSVRAYLPLVR